MSASHIRIDTVIETGDGCFGQNGFRKDLSYLHLQYYNGKGRKSKVLSIEKLMGSRVQGSKGASEMIEPDR
jgi:hypothetical protein